MILRRYITNEIAIIYMQIMAIVLIIFLMRFISLYLFYLSDGFIQASDFAKLLLFRVLSSLEIISQFSIVTAIFITFYRYSQSNELLVFSSIGLSPKFLVKNLFPLWLVIFLVSALLSLVISPGARHHYNKIKEASNSASMIDKYPSGTFNTIKKDPLVMLHARNNESNKKYFEDVFIQYERDNKQIIVTAKRARKVLDSTYKAPYFLLYDGNQYVGIPGGNTYTVTNFSELGLKIPAPTERVIIYPNKDKTTTALLDSTSKMASIELHSRIHTPISTIVLSILILLVVKYKPRQSSYFMIVLAACIYFLYAYFYHTVLASWLSIAPLSPAVGYWLFELVFLLSAVLFTKLYGLNISQIRQRQFFYDKTFGIV